MKIHRTLALVAIFGVVPFAAAFAGQAQARQRGGMDADRDGVITRAEWRGTAEGFHQLDTNRDGVLSGTEAQAALQDPSSTDEAARAREAALRVAAMDADRDGVITRAEWKGTAEGFRQQDTNHDGVLSGGEVRAVVPDPSPTDEERRRRASAAARFAGMDRDHDGVVTRAEWRGNTQSFRQHDTNGDGVLSGTEVAPSQAESEAERRRREGINYQFTGADQNRDGRISRDEWAGNTAEFTRMDRNTDGIVTREEFGGSAGDSTAPTSGERRPTPAYQAGHAKGLVEGRDAGKADRGLSARGRWDLEGQSELEQADSGYYPAVGSREEYQNGYRTGFRLGYKEGFGPR